MSRLNTIVAAGVVAVLGLTACGQEAKVEAQQPNSSGTAVTQVGPPDQPGWPARRPLPEIADAEAAAIMGMLTGSYESAAEGDRPALVYSAARIDVEGLDNAVYFEIARVDSHWRPYRQGVFHIWRRGGKPMLRVLGFGGAPSFPNAVTGMWLVPDLFPPVTAVSLVPRCDIELTKTGEGYQGRTVGRALTMQDGAVTFEAEMGLGSKRITMADRGYDAADKQVFGLPAGQSVTFTPAAARAQLKRTDDGLAVIDMIPPATGVPAASPESDGRVAVHYTGWLQTDGWKFASSRDERWDSAAADPQLFTLKARLLSGWSKGMPGMTKGTLRRLVIPSGMAFHTSGSPQWRVPPNAGVVFEVECMWVEEVAPATVVPATPVEEKPEEGKADGQTGAGAKPAGK